MNLFVKIPKGNLNVYRKEFIECLKHNSNNSNIKGIFVYTDQIDHKIEPINKTKVLFKRNLPTDIEIVSYSKSNTENKIIYSDPFVKFEEDLYKVTDEELENFVIKGQKYFIYSKKSNLISTTKLKFGKSEKLSQIITKTIDITILDSLVKNNSNILVKKSVYVSPETAPTKRLKKLDVVIVSIHYNDYLVISLKHNTQIFENITVVTSPDDIICQEICKKYKVNCVITDVMYEDGSIFNKGKAVNAGINSIDNPDLILLLDSDIIVEESIDLQNLSDQVLYTSERIILLNYNSYKDYLENGKSKRTKIENDKGYGFFQLFCINNKSIKINNLYSEEYEDASCVDLEFRDRFPYRKTIPNSCLHLGEPFRNWKGRITDKFITEDELSNLITQIKAFNINNYFDKIYCLNLDIRTDRWKKVSSQFESFEINVERWPAIKGEDIEDDLFSYFNPENITGEEASLQGLVENKNAIACLFSHLEIIKDAKSKGYKRILILEDDVIINENIDKEFKKIKDKNWKILYLGASQFNWSKINYINGFYYSKKTYGTFAYALDSSIYDDIINLYENGRKSVDNLLIDFQESNEIQCLTFLPNIIQTDVSESDIRQSKDQSIYNNINKWENKECDNEKKLRVLLVPDTKGWAFDNISTSIIKYNPNPERVYYKKVFITDIRKGLEINYNEWDYIFVFFEGERIIKPSKKVIRGCYSAFWIENSDYSTKIIAENFNKCGGSIYANKYLKDCVSEYLDDDHKKIIIEDGADENIFYPIEGVKNEKFTAIFVGNSERKIKNFNIIESVCKKSDIELIVCNNIEHNKLVDYYNKAHVCINFSDFEGGPQTFIESALCGVPMIVRSNNELSKHIPCFKADSEENLLKLVNELKNNKKICQNIGEQAMKKALENFTYKKVSEKFTNFFLDLESKNSLNEK